MLTLLDGKTALCPVDPKWAFGQRQKWPGGVARGHSDQIDSLKYQSKINTNLVFHSLTFYFILFYFILGKDLLCPGDLEMERTQL